jgi:hypothetical protein
MDYTHLDDTALHRFTRRRLQDRPTDAQAWRVNIVELRELAAEIRASMEQRKSTMSRASGGLVLPVGERIDRRAISLLDWR